MRSYVPYAMCLKIFFALSLTSCQKSIDLQGFDNQMWKQDTKGCQNKRQALLADFEQKIKPQLKGLTEKELIAVLGKADKQELFKRNQKFYSYYLEAGKQCEAGTTNTTPRRLQIRIDAINQVSEVVILTQ
jgi:hypothetical protein